MHKHIFVFRNRGKLRNQGLQLGWRRVSKSKSSSCFDYTIPKWSHKVKPITLIARDLFSMSNPQVGKSERRNVRVQTHRSINLCGTVLSLLARVSSNQDRTNSDMTNVEVVVYDHQDDYGVGVWSVNKIKFELIFGWLGSWLPLMWPSMVDVLT